MSYVHCPSCARAYNQARDRACPSCVGSGENAVLAAYEAFVKAIAIATPEQVGTAFASLAARAPIESTELVAPPPAPRLRRRDRLVAGLATLARRATRVVGDRFAKTAIDRPLFAAR